MKYTYRLKRFGLYTDNAYPYTSLEQVKAITGADIVLNGQMYDIAARKPVCTMKKDGVILNKDQYDYWGYGWNGPSLGTDGVLPTFTNDVTKWDNMISCVEMIRDGQKQTMYYPAALGGSRGRTAIGFKADGTFVLWCSQDGREPKTMEELQQLMFDAGCHTALNLDGGGSSEAITPDGSLYTTRTIYNYVCGWLEGAEGKNPSTAGGPPPFDKGGKDGGDGGPSSGSAEPPSPAGKAEGGNSTLVDVTILSPHKRTRAKPISKITIHHMACCATVEQCGAGFSAQRVASSNYGIDGKGRVGLYVEEKDRAVTSSNTDNDNMAVAIEVANSDAKYPWPVSDAAYAKLIDLCVDICRRNGIAKLIYTGDATGNLTRHNMFAATQCPGAYLQERFPAIAEEVNERLGAGENPTTASGPPPFDKGGKDEGDGGPSSGSAEPPSPAGKAEEGDGKRTVYRVMEVTAEAEKLCKQRSSHGIREYAEKSRRAMTDAGKLAYVKEVQL